MSDLALIAALEKKALWLAAWMIHNANHLRPSRDGLKVGGHQASSASVATILAALYFDALRPEDRVAVKPHASPVFHAIQYLYGKQTLQQIQDFRSLGGAQAYPSRRKDIDDVDLSTGSVGLGAAITSFASLTRDYLAAHKLLPEGAALGKMVAIVGDAELDEGNVFEALLEGWKHDVRNLWWIIDYNRQSLDTVVTDRLFGPIQGMFATTGWQVEILKYGRLLEAAFKQKGGAALRDWIDACANTRYSALVFKGGAAWRAALTADIGGKPGVKALLAAHDDESLARLMTNLAGHDLETLTDAFAKARNDDRPHCFIAYTVKGFGLPFAGHKDNHAGLMNPDQMAAFQAANKVPSGQEWEKFAGLDVPAAKLEKFLATRPWAQSGPRRFTDAAIQVPAVLSAPGNPKSSTQEGFGRLMAEIAREDSALAARIVTTSPDVTVSTNLGGWVNRRGVFFSTDNPDTFKAEQVASAQRWAAGPDGQHIELGIAEHNLFLLLGALGLSESLFGARLLPVGTLYDPFILRGLDALNYALYQDARFLLVATPSGLTLSPEGGAHQSVITPLIGLSQPGLTSFEPAYVDELAVILRWAFMHLQAPDGGAAYLRLSTRPLMQPARQLDAEAVLAGGYWAEAPAPGAGLAIVYTGAVAPEARAAFEAIREDIPGAGLLAVTSADLLYRNRETVAKLLAPLSPDAKLVTIIDGHPATLSWLGGVRGQKTVALGTQGFGQSGDIPDLYRVYRLDTDSIIDAVAQSFL